MTQSYKSTRRAELEVGLPTKVGPYTIGEKLGNGGHCCVYTGHREVPLRTQKPGGAFIEEVAIKMIRPDREVAESTGRLLQNELLIGSLLEHPNIVRTLEGIVQDDRMYIVMERLQGPTLSELTSRHSYAPNGSFFIDELIVTEILRQIAQGLHYLHTRDRALPQAVHRDLKPANIIITPQGVVQICDFGVTQSDGVLSAFTEGTIVGSPAYMSPEQTKGKSLDARSDLFVFGSTLFKVTMKAHAFLRQDWRQSLNMIASGDHESQLRRTRHRSPKLAEILRRCWQVKPENRYSNAMELAWALEEAQRRILAERGEVGPVCLADWIQQQLSTKNTPT